MQFDKNKRLKLSHENCNTYPFWINFYTTPPNYKVSLQEIEDSITERLKILKIIDNFMKNADKSKMNDFYDAIISQINSLKCNNEKNFYVIGRNESNPKAADARKRDHISHFLLRIYYCQNENLRRWFISREAELFRIRFIDSSLTNHLLLEKCLAYYGYNYEIVSTADNLDFHNKVNWSDYNKHKLSSIAFKLNFEDAIDLVRMRKVYLKQGYAFIGSNEMISVIYNQFKTNLSRELTKMCMHFHSFNEQRLLCRLESLHQYYVASTTKTSSNNGTEERIHPEEINQLAKDFFPPCMRSIHEILRKDHHLKHYGRLHYGLFLKSLGLKLEDAIEFFRSELSIHNAEKFQKEYTYTIRYIYGKEGKKVQLSAYRCQKIINENAPGPNDTHGCPFKHYDINNLKALLVRYGINKESDLEEIISSVTNGKNSMGACSKFFSIKYQQQNLPETFSIYHPNQFYNEARRLFNSNKIPEEHQDSTSIDMVDGEDIINNNDNDKINHSLEEDNSFESFENKQEIN